MQTMVHAQTKNWSEKLKHFPISTLQSWNLQRDELYFKAYAAYRDFEKNPHQEGADEKCVAKATSFFHLPLHAEILKKAATKSLQRFLRTVYTGPDTTLLEKITEALYEYHIVNAGEGLPPDITLTRSQLQRLGTDIPHFRSVLEALAEALDPIIDLRFKSNGKNGLFLSVDITVFLPRTDCSMDFVKEKEMLA